MCLKLLGGTTVETTPLVRHYVPAAVVTVHTGGCPWTEALAPLNAVSPAQGGARFSGGLSVLGDGSAEMRGESLRPGAEFGFYEAEVFGSVSGALVAALPLEFVCPSATLPVPHYASAVDPLWRFGELEAAAALADVAAHQPSVRGLFEPPWPLPPGVEWGTLFPVTGWQDAGHDYRNAANVAQRAAFVATNRDFGLPGPLGANLHVRAALAGGGFPATPGMPNLPALPDLPTPDLDVLERTGKYRFGGWGTLWLPDGVEPDSQGRYTRSSVAWLDRDEVEALLRAPDPRTRVGRRDRTLLTVAVQTGLRASELISLRCGDVQLGAGAHLRCHGKGRKERHTPLRKDASAMLKAWLKERCGEPDDPVFPNQRGRSLSHDSLDYLLAKHLSTARVECPSLKQKRVTPHCLSHTAAMELLTNGVDRAVIALWLGHESV